jgi:hypothetical protein
MTSFLPYFPILGYKNPRLQAISCFHHSVLFQPIYFPSCVVKTGKFPSRCNFNFAPKKVGKLPVVGFKPTNTRTRRLQAACRIQFSIFSVSLPLFLSESEDLSVVPVLLPNCLYSDSVKSSSGRTSLILHPYCRMLDEFFYPAPVECFSDLL